MMQRVARGTLHLYSDPCSAHAWKSSKRLLLIITGLCSLITLLLYLSESNRIGLQTQVVGRDDAKEDREKMKDGEKFDKSLLISKSVLLPYIKIENKGSTLSYNRTNTSPSVASTLGKENNSYPSPLYKNQSLSDNPNVMYQIQSNKSLVSQTRKVVFGEKGPTRESSIQECGSGNSNFSFVPPFRLVHFDLKGAPPKISYFEKILPVLKANGATGILMEYEDMFPFSGPLASVAAPNAYTVEDIGKIRSLAKMLHLELIPLVQTFGHMEFVLKLPEFQHLRESDDSPSSLCPSNNGSVWLVAEIIDQVMSYHPDAKWLHIGCDEVFYIGLCKKCNKYQYKKDILYLQHVTKVARYVRRKHKVIPIIWDDMIRRTSSHILRASNVGSLVEPMVWVYAEDVPSFFFPRMWHRYRIIFPHMWTASAFKGAFGRASVVPNAERHLNNHISWLAAMKERERSTNFRGMVLTGWQRYEHFGPLCELLPVGMPSLILNLLTVTHGCFREELLIKLRETLNCSSAYLPFNTSQRLSLHTDPYLRESMVSCSFSGSDMFDVAQEFISVNDTVEDYVHTACDAYKRRSRLRQMIFPNIDEMASKLVEYNISVWSSFNSSREALAEVYDKFTVREWIEQNLRPLAEKLDKVWKLLFTRTFSDDLCSNDGRQKKYTRIFSVVD